MLSDTYTQPNVNNVKVLHPNRHKIGHFEEVPPSPEANLLVWYGLN